MIGGNVPAGSGSVAWNYARYRGSCQAVRREINRCELIDPSASGVKFSYSAERACVCDSVSVRQLRGVKDHFDFLRNLNHAVPRWQTVKWKPGEALGTPPSR